MFVKWKKIRFTTSIQSSTTPSVIIPLKLQVHARKSVKERRLVTSDTTVLIMTIVLLGTMLLAIAQG